MEVIKYFNVWCISNVCKQICALQLGSTTPNWTTLNYVSCIKTSIFSKVMINSQVSREDSAQVGWNTANGTGSNIPNKLWIWMVPCAHISQFLGNVLKCWGHNQHGMPVINVVVFKKARHYEMFISQWSLVEKVITIDAGENNSSSFNIIMWTDRLNPGNKTPLFPLCWHGIGSGLKNKIMPFVTNCMDNAVHVFKVNIVSLVPELISRIHVS